MLSSFRLQQIRHDIRHIERAGCARSYPGDEALAMLNSMAEALVADDNADHYTADGPGLEVLAWTVGYRVQWRESRFMMSAEDLAEEEARVREHQESETLLQYRLVCRENAREAGGVLGGQILAQGGPHQIMARGGRAQHQKPQESQEVEGSL